MKSLIFKFLKKNILNFILGEVMSDTFKKKLADNINKVIDIPGLNEREERAIIVKVINGTTDTITKHFS